MITYALLAYLIGIPTVAVSIFCVRKWNDGRAGGGRSIFNRSWYEDDPAMVIGPLFWPVALPIALCATMIWKAIQPVGRALESLGRKTAERAKEKNLQEREKQLLLKKYEAEIDQMLQERR